MKAQEKVLKTGIQLVTDKIQEINSPKKQSEVEHFIGLISDMVKNHWSNIEYFVKMEQKKTDSYQELVTLLELIGREAFDQLSEGLSTDEKIQIKNLLEKNKGHKIELAHLKNLYISLKKALITPKTRTKTLGDIIATFSTPEIVAFSVKEPELASQLFHRLPQEQLSHVFNKLELNSITSITTDALANDPDDFDENLLLEKMSEFKKINNSSFLMSNLEVIMDDVSPQKEQIILELLISQKKWEQLEKICTNSFPALLFERFEAQTQKDFFQELSPEEKVNLLLSYEDEQRGRMFQLMATKGSKAFEVLSSEISNIENNQSQLMQIKTNANTIQKEFVKKLRVFIKANKQDEANSIVLNWLQELKEK